MPVIIGIDPMPVARVADPELATIKPRDIGGRVVASGSTPLELHRIGAAVGW